MLTGRYSVSGKTQRELVHSFSNQNDYTDPDIRSIVEAWYPTIPASVLDEVEAGRSRLVYNETLDVVQVESF